MEAGPPLGTHGPRVAFCLSGGSRAMLLGMPSISEYFINELQPDPTLRHMFLEVSTAHDCALRTATQHGVSTSARSPDTNHRMNARPGPYK